MNTIIYIHGWMTFKSEDDYFDYLSNRPISIEERKKWDGEFLSEGLDDKCTIVKPYMPCKDNARYFEWKIHFERYLPFVDNKTILIGKSLGWIFLAKYLSENQLPDKVLSVYLVCPPFDNTLPDEDLVWWFELWEDLSLLYNNCINLHLIFSEDDPVIPISHAQKYKSKLSEWQLHIYKDKWHFSIAEFPEIVELIKCDITNI